MQLCIDDKTSVLYECIMPEDEKNHVIMISLLLFNTIFLGGGLFVKVVTFFRRVFMTVFFNLPFLLMCQIICINDNTSLV